MVRLRWELNEEGVPVWPPTIAEEGEDTKGLSSFDAWVTEPLEEEAESSSTPPTSQPAIMPTPLSLARPTPIQPSLFQTPAAPVDTSILVDLTDD
ncbi:hypothetical protein SLEP1_g22783 [Rubroshorea leprosula]|uniref:Uncharacterized protein n=1 Tax=Rubroshorea leprosula TaxID=152421 RepID=A0AAV5JJG7_9ROSI|nr:hypothetical protein SLEP1_g22783 [Rubroshorea leprosula]